ncbi:MAG: AMP-binding protein, partial [Acidimicrobiia bacterium]|nr:AMP-binding protein [Acidimicrobiia bacterium]
MISRMGNDPLNGIPDAAQAAIEAAPNAQAAWTAVQLYLSSAPFETHHAAYRRAYRDHPEPWPTWLPEWSDRTSNLHRFLANTGHDGLTGLAEWSSHQPGAFWGAIADDLGIVFAEPAVHVLGPGFDPRAPDWFAGAKLNAVASCLAGDQQRTAIIHRRNGAVHRLTVTELADLVDKFASGLVGWGVRPGDRVAIAMSMNVEAVVAYLGIIHMGGVVVSIADSFAPDQISKRLVIADTAAVVTEATVDRLGKTLPMYAKVCSAEAPRAIVVGEAVLRPDDVAWDDLMSRASGSPLHIADPGDHTNILFSSGTTGEPKAIPWSHTTPIKAAADGYLHQDIQHGDVVCWPTNLGWMMGPWAIYASLVNGAALALFDDAPTAESFGDFVAEAGVTMLGVVPSIVRAWRAQGWLNRFDWSSVRVASSTGEPSSADDMLYLSAMIGHRPIIEYCGGTEIGGGYIASTVLDALAPATFSRVSFGWDMLLLDENGEPADRGEVWLVPPSVGMSTELLNRNHHAEYYEGAPSSPDGRILRRHGDQMERLPGGYYRAEGRSDDTMNLGGIKVSSAEIERCLSGIAGLVEAAAVAERIDGGPEQLVIHAVFDANTEPSALLAEMQERIRSELNPLFKVSRLVRSDKLPRTASN